MNFRRAIMPSFVSRMAGALKEYFGEPESPYTKANPEFRADLAKVESAPLLQALNNQLRARSGFRSGSLSNAILVSTVVLTSGFMFFDSLTDRIVSVSPWARPMFLPSLWAVTIALHFFIKSVKAPKDEVDPNPRYAGDEAEYELANATGSAASIKSHIEGGTEPEISEVRVAHAQVTETASRMYSDRVSLRTGRFYRNRSLTWLWYAVVAFVAALTVYAAVSPFTS